MKSESKSLSAVHKAAGESELDLCTALDTCVHAEKIRELVVNEKSSLRLTKKNIPKTIMVVNEKSSLRELTIAVLMTHWDYIAPVFFFR